MKTFFRPNNSIIIAGDKYTDTPQINQSFDDNIRDITLREKSIFKNVTTNSTLYDRTLCAQKNSSDISNNQVPALPREGYEFIDPFLNESKLNRTPESLNQTTIFNNPNLESQQIREKLPNKTNQITLDDRANIKQALNLLKFSHPLSTSRKSDKGVSVNNLPNNSSNNLPNNLLIQSIEMMNLPTNQQVSLRDALEIIPYFNGSSKKPLTLFIEACKEAKEMFPLQKII